MSAPKDRQKTKPPGAQKGQTQNFQKSEKSQKSQLYSYKDTPEWMRASYFLTHGYRPETPNQCECVCTLFQLHNETVNIWTHLIPAIIYPLHVIFQFSIIFKTTGKIKIFKISYRK